jgi:acyl-CoA synthetase (AMP-forming)/AMP-acid ligase II
MMPAARCRGTANPSAASKCAGSVARAYFKEEGEVLDRDGFFDTGDVATIDPHGYMQITDRSKDVIESGGEWISSIDLENLAVGHPKVAEAAVIGVRHPRWDERPLLVVVQKKSLLPRQDRQLVDPRRCRFRRGNPPHCDRQDPKGGAARAVQRLPLSIDVTIASHRFRLYS